MHSYHTVWASILAFACILLVLGLLLCIPFSLAKLRGMHPGLDRLMDKLAGWMGATAPSTDSKGNKHPAPRSFLRSLKVTRYSKPDDVEAAAQDCCAICCCEYEAGQPITRLSCHHMFHKECILAWLKVDAVCPMCKTDLLASQRTSPPPEGSPVPAAPAPAVQPHVSAAGPDPAPASTQQCSTSCSCGGACNVGVLQLSPTSTAVLAGAEV